MTTVLLVEDDEVFRIGLTLALKQSPNIELVAVCTDGLSAIDAAEKHTPDVILMDLGLPVMTGMDATQRIKAKHPYSKVLALTSHSEPKYVDEIMRAGADGYCLKGISTERLLHLIQEVHQGTFWIDATVADQFKARLSQTLEPPPIPKETLNMLTEREAEVLAWIAQGKKNNEIAEILHISPGTVRVHVHAILNKLNVKTRTQAVLFVKA